VGAFNTEFSVNIFGGAKNFVRGLATASAQVWALPRGGLRPRAGVAVREGAKGLIVPRR
jgi:hypothetical protein